MSDEMKRDIEKLKSEAADARATTKLIIKTLVRIEAKVDDGFAEIATRMATRNDISGLNDRIDGLAGKVDDMNLKWANHRDRLDDHHKRIIRLEDRRA